MKALRHLLIPLLILLCSSGIQAQDADSVDVMDYDIFLDLGTETPLNGHAILTLRLLRPCDSISLRLAGTVDSLKVNGLHVATPSLSAIPTAAIPAGQPFYVSVWYKLRGYVESGGWGGLHIDNDMTYNLGVGFNTNPHTLGRALFPCRDNFTDKATYTLRLKTKAGWSAECGGLLQSRTLDDDGAEHSVWRIDHPTPTYLVSVSQAPWTRIHDTIASLHGHYPLTLAYLNRDSAQVHQAFAQLDSVVPMFERCFGPYRWERIGYIATRKGSMEHVNNIALDRVLINAMSERAQTTIAHELGHAWFGNLITCATEADMWINEGGASFTSEVALEAVSGRQASDDYYQRNLESVIRDHIANGITLPLSPMPHSETYGTTTYDKGWMVWHSLRGYLGEEAFYSALRRLMASCAFGNLDAYQLRDSLSLYTGVDLTDFFDFHVFSPGFVDYYVSAIFGGCNPSSAWLTLRQQPVGGTTPMRSARVPVTFFSATGDTVKRWISFDGQTHEAVLTLPIVPEFCVLDYDKEISDAATLGVGRLQGNGTAVQLSLAHINLRSSRPVNVYVEHHWGNPHGVIPYGTVRMARRYWMLRGTWDRQDAVKGRFFYVRNGNDRGFLSSTASFDSLALLYRPYDDSEWRPVSFSRGGSGSENYLVADSLLPGEYTLAVVDSLRIGISPVSSGEINLFPNPLGQGQEFSVGVLTDAPFTIVIFDSEARQVWKKEGCVSGEKLRPALTRGTYFVLIENNFISLHSKLIQL